MTPAVQPTLSTSKIVIIGIETFSYLSPATSGAASTPTFTGGGTGSGSGDKQSSGGYGGNGDGNPSNGAGGSGSGSSGTSNPPEASHRLPPSLIAVIIVVAILVLAFLCLLGVRTFYKQRRGRRLKRWVSWKQRAKALGFFGLDGVADEKDTASSRATSYRPGRVRVSDLEGAYRVTPGSLSDTRNSSSTLSSLGTLLPTASAAHRISDGSSRFSFTSQDTQTTHMSDAIRSSVSSAQCISYPAMQPDKACDAQLSPISVSPWTPSERWQFPKPPEPNGATSPPIAANSLGGHTMTTERSGSPDSYSDDKTIRRLSDPFADPTTISSTGSSRHDSVLSMARSDSAAFSDYAASHHISLISTTSSEISALTNISDSAAGIMDTIKRSFEPRSRDELTIARGDQICIRKRFDDGWLYVEKTSTAEKGFIPQDCLRGANEPLPVYLTKRYSCYNACAM